MRRLIVGVLLPATALGLVIYARAIDDGVHRYHPWEMRWDVWLLSVIVTSMMVGVGLHMFWAEPLRSAYFDHDAVQLAADDQGTT